MQQAQAASAATRVGGRGGGGGSTATGGLPARTQGPYDTESLMLEQWTKWMIHKDGADPGRQLDYINNMGHADKIKQATNDFWNSGFGTSRYGEIFVLPKAGSAYPSGLPKYAKGGYVTGETQAIIGEGGEPEYVIPASKMGAAMSRYAGGARGESVLNGGQAPAVNISHTGQIVQMDGENYLKTSDLNGIVQSAMMQTIKGLGRSPQMRRAAGI
jgi:hypothetical protein